MRTLTLIPLAFLASSCWKPGPGEIDPTRYPWDVREQPVRGTGEHGHEVQQQPELAPQTQPRPVAEPQLMPEQQPEPAPEFYACVVALTPPENSGIQFVGGGQVDECPANPSANAPHSTPPTANSDNFIEASPPASVSPSPPPNPF